MIGAAFFLGLAWASFFSEYLLHRWVFHNAWLRARVRAPPIQEHVRHHFAPYFAPFWIKAVFVVPPLLVVPYVILGSWGFALGLTWYYVFLELMHFSMHWTAPSTTLGLQLRKYHLYHHFVDATSNFGFVGGIVYDWLLGSSGSGYRSDMVVPVAANYAIPWLHDGERILSPYEAHFRLKPLR